VCTLVSAPRAKLNVPLSKNRIIRLMFAYNIVEMRIGEGKGKVIP
jgi:hypothetical protein